MYFVQVAAFSTGRGLDIPNGVFRVKGKNGAICVENGSRRSNPAGASGRHGPAPRRASTEVRSVSNPGCYGDSGRGGQRGMIRSPM